MIDLHPCPSCQRHVSVADAACPFCGAAQPEHAPLAMPRGRLSRAAVFAAGTLAAASAGAACGGKTKPDPGPGGGGGEVAVDAAPAEDTTPDAAPVVVPDDIQPMPYGAPPARHRVV
jgi:hypothetical protein